MGPKPEFLARVEQRQANLRATLAALIPDHAVITLEIGSGHGHFLTQYAAEFPQRIFLGVDLISDRIRRSKRKAERARLAHCHFVQAEARETIDALPAGVTFDELWVLFPDPWPKKRHHKNRLLLPGFFSEVARRMGQGARLYFRTDHLEYFRSVVALFPHLPGWCPDPAAPWPLEHETVFQARAPQYHSLVAVRTEDPNPPAGKAGSLPSGPVIPKSSA
ncbi:MAG TPA: methyltransferase domain-containing protein [Lacunisphaera sp.]|nr:methyltransferase domain-containing protein [Lacunisphaera sp.]